MDKQSVHLNKSLSLKVQAKPKKRPFKVVYISSPMKVKTSASKFRSVVQGLTGRDSNHTRMERFLAIDGRDEPQRVPDKETDQGVDDELSHVFMPVPAGAVDHELESSPVSAECSLKQIDDDVFTPEMLENFTGLPAWSNLMFSEWSSLMFFQPHGDR